MSKFLRGVRYIATDMWAEPRSFDSNLRFKQYPALNGAVFGYGLIAVSLPAVAVMALYGPRFGPFAGIITAVTSAVLFLAINGRPPGVHASTECDGELRRYFTMVGVLRSQLNTLCAMLISGCMLVFLFDGSAYAAYPVTTKAATVLHGMTGLMWSAIAFIVVIRAIVWFFKNYKDVMSMVACAR